VGDGRVQPALLCLLRLRGRGDEELPRGVVERCKARGVQRRDAVCDRAQLVEWVRSHPSSPFLLRY
jgi:hypothetical protein